MPKTDQVANPNATTEATNSAASNQGAAGNPGDPTNPAGAPRLTLVIDDAARRDADAELQGLLRKDTTKLGEAALAAHQKRVWELHYLANGEQPPKR